MLIVPALPYRREHGPVGLPTQIPSAWLCIFDANTTHKEMAWSTSTSVPWSPAKWIVSAWLQTPSLPLQTNRMTDMLSLAEIPHLSPKHETLMAAQRSHSRSSWHSCLSVWTPQTCTVHELRKIPIFTSINRPKECHSPRSNTNTQAYQFSFYMIVFWFVCSVLLVVTALWGSSDRLGLLGANEGTGTANSKLHRRKGIK